MKKSCRPFGNDQQTLIKHMMHSDKKPTIQRSNGVADDVSKLRAREGTSAGRNFARNISGVAAIEFALVAVPFFGVLFAVMEIGLFFFYASTLQMATELASRKIMAGTLSPETTVESFIGNELCKPKGLLKGLFDCSKIRVDIGSPDSWNAADVAKDYENLNADRQALANPPAAGRIGILRVGYPKPVFFNLFGIGDDHEIKQITEGTTIEGGRRVRMIMGIAAFRVER